MLDFCLSCQLYHCLPQEFRQSFHNLILLLCLLVSNLIDIVLEEEHLNVIGLPCVPLVGHQHSHKLFERDITAHPYTVLLDKLLKVALVVL